MADLFCKNITSAKRHLPENAKLLLGDQITGGSAVKTGNSEQPDQNETDQLAGEIFGTLQFTDLYPVGTVLGAGDFVTEGGFVAGPDGADVIHSGYGGEAKAFAAGTDLKPGDLVINGQVNGPNGEVIDAPFQVDTEGYTVADDGAVVSPTSDGEDDAYCSLQELAGKPERGNFLDDAIAELDLDLDIPGLDMAWWVVIQQKINELTALQGKFLAKTRNLVALVEMDPDDACKYVPNVEKLLKIMRKVQRNLSKVRKILKQVRKIIKAIKKAIKLLKFIFAPIRIVEAFLFLLQIVNGMVNMIDIAFKNITDTTKILPQLIAQLSKILAQCATNRGMESGLTKEQCEALGGIYVEQRPGDIGDTAGGIADDGTDSLADGLGDGTDDEDYLEPGLNLNPGDTISSGTAVNNTTGDSLTAPATIPNEDGWNMGPDGGTGESDNAMMSQDELEALINSQIIDMQECLTDLDDFEKTRDFS